MLSKKTLIYIAIVLFCVLIGKAFFSQTQSALKTARVVIPAGGYFIVEIAETEKQRMQGLMYRRFLAKDNGMLFVFEQVDIQKVWMKNTLIDLDVIFIAESGLVVSIVKNLKPCVQLACEIYPSSKKAKYMLEVNAGIVEKTAIRLGQKLVFEGL